MEILRREIRDWTIEAEDLGKIGQTLGDSMNDVQRKKLSLYITKEVMVQCKEICELAEDLQRRIEELMEYTETENEKLQKVKKYSR